MKRFVSVGSTVSENALTKSVTKFALRRGGAVAFGARSTSKGRKNSRKKNGCGQPDQRRSARDANTNPEFTLTNNGARNYQRRTIDNLKRIKQRAISFTRSRLRIAK